MADLIFIDRPIFPEDDLFGPQGFSFSEFQEALAQTGDEVTVEIFSPGGSVIEGLAIYDEIQRSDKTISVSIIGMAGSIASIIALAVPVERRTMTANAEFFIHNPMNMAVGDAEELQMAADRTQAIQDRLTQIYTDNSALSTEEVQNAMDAETTFTAEEALEAGFISSITPNLQAAAIRTRIMGNTNKKTSLMDQIRKLVASASEDEKRVVVLQGDQKFEVQAEALEDGMKVSLEAGDYETEEGRKFTVNAEGEISFETVDEIKEEFLEEVKEIIQEVVGPKDEQIKELQEELSALKKRTKSPKVAAVRVLGDQGDEIDSEDVDKKTKPFAPGGRWANRIEQITKKHATALKEHKTGMGVGF